MDRWTHQFLAVVQQDAIQEYGHERRLYEPRAFETRRLKDDVIRLPLAGSASGVHQRRPLSIQRARLSVRVGEVVERIEDLYFVTSMQEDAAVTAVLTVTTYLCRRRPIDVRLHVSETFLRS